MSKLKIYTYPDIILTQKAKPIERVEKSYRKLADDMLETMYDAPGIGLAGNQVGVLEKILVIDVDYDIQDPDDIDGPSILVKKNPIIIINPEILLREGKTAINEGCLSVPEYTAEVQRSQKIKLKYLDIDGVEKTLSAEELLAVAIQHEMDHLDGKLFIDRLSPLKKELAQKKLKKERAEREARKR